MEIIYMPRLGQTMESGIVLRWRVNLHDVVAQGDPLYDVETEKVEIEVEAKGQLRVARFIAEIGTEIAVGDMVMVVASIDEAISDDLIDALIGTVSTDQIVQQQESISAGPSNEQVRAMPRARALAKELGVDLGQITGTGENGLVTVKDVEVATRETYSRDEAPLYSAGELSHVQKVMGQKMSTSWKSIPHFFETRLIDAHGLVEWRKSQESVGRPSVTALLLKAVANSYAGSKSVHSERHLNLANTNDGKIMSVRIGVATDTSRGLVVPVLEVGLSQTASEIGLQLVELVALARGGNLGIDHVKDADITLSNLGAYGVDFGQPIIPPGQSAMVFVGALKKRPMVIQEQVVARESVYITIASDHRVIDGAAAAKILGMIGEFIESISENSSV
jgi:pyruvate dehydrogenase E2 component (dihydrolipoamide acetyltransferase)